MQPQAIYDRLMKANGPEEISKRPLLAGANPLDKLQVIASNKLLPLALSSWQPME
jgi:hypothetical protein